MFCSEISMHYKSSSIEYKRSLIHAVKKYPKVWNIDVDADEVDDDWDYIAENEMGFYCSANECKSIWDTVRSLYYRQIFIRTIERRFEAPQWPFFHDMSFMYEIVKQDIQTNLGGIAPPLFRVIRNPTDPVIQCPCCIYIDIKPSAPPVKSISKVSYRNLHKPAPETSQYSPQNKSLEEKTQSPQICAVNQLKVYKKNLITAIKARPVIYDPSMQTQMKLNYAWREVSKEMGNVDIGALKNYWNMLKSRYTKELREQSWKRSIMDFDMEFYRPFAQLKVDEANSLRSAGAAAVEKEKASSETNNDITLNSTGKAAGASSKNKNDIITFNSTGSLRTYCRKPKVDQPTSSSNSNDISILQNRPIKVKVLHSIDDPNNDTVQNNRKRQDSRENLTQPKKICLTSPSLGSDQESNCAAPVIVKINATPIAVTKQSHSVRVEPQPRQYSNKITVAPVLSLPNINQTCYVNTQPQKPNSLTLNHKTLITSVNRSFKITPISVAPENSHRNKVGPPPSTKKGDLKNTEPIPLDPKTLEFLQKRSIVIKPLSVTTSERQNQELPKRDIQILGPYPISELPPLLQFAPNLPSRVFPSIDLTINEEES